MLKPSGIFLPGRTRISWRHRRTYAKKPISFEGIRIRKQYKKAQGYSNKRDARLTLEKGSYLKKWTGRLPVALLYPNTYEVGMSSLGYQLVYALLAEDDQLVCERFFLPENGEPLRSMESQRPLNHFPLIFISISFEHDYLNLVKMLRAASIEPFAGNRSESISSEQPLVICGGVATFMNPEPLAPFVDLMILGEAEPVLPALVQEIADSYEGKTRSELLRSLATTRSSCYVPGLYTPVYDEDGLLSSYQAEAGIPQHVTKSVVEKSPVAGHSQLITPEAEFSEMHLTELGRGCSRGCRFCAAGFIYRPPRLWDGDAVVEGLRARYSDVDRVGLLGMEMANSESLEMISDYLRESGCALSFSSLRADRLNQPLIDLLSASKLKSVAIAPDGCSERLRRVINKGLDEQDLLDAAERLVDAGIFKLKLYLMIGLPTESDEDLQEAIDLVKKIKDRIDPIGKARGRLTEIGISVNCFAPKPWTPFQYHPFGMSDPLPKGELGDSKKVVMELKRRQKLLRRELSKIANVHLQFDKPESVLFQAVLARADRRIATVLNDMAERGLNWKQAMKKNALTPEQFAICGFDESSWFGWYVIDHGIKHDYLWCEYQRAFDEKTTSACDTSICRRCGVCNE